MSDLEIQASFGPSAQDRAALSTANRRTLEAFYRHPIAHNLDRLDVVALFNKLGSVQQGENSAITYSIGDEHYRVAKSHGHSLMTDEVMGLRHLLTRAGWGPGHPTESAPSGAISLSGDVLVVVEETAARLFPLDLRAADQSGHTIHAADPHRILRHLAHRDQGRDDGERTAVDGVFFEAIAKLLTTDGRIVLVGHGQGHSNAAKLFSEYLHTHHPLIFKRLVNAVAADFPQMTDKQLLELARTALTA